MAGKKKQDKEHLIAVRLTGRQYDRLRQLSDAIGGDGNISAAIRYAAQKVYIPVKAAVAAESQQVIG